MINEIIAGVTTNLYNAFGRSIRIYTDTIEQGLIEPCFFVLCVREGERPLLNARAIRDVAIVIDFLDNGNNNRLQAMASELFKIMRRITLIDGSQLNGFDLHYEITEDVLHFFVTFKPVIYYNSEETIPLQETLELNTGVQDETQGS